MMAEASDLPLTCVINESDVMRLDNAKRRPVTASICHIDPSNMMRSADLDLYNLRHQCTEPMSLEQKSRYDQAIQQIENYKTNVLELNADCGLDSDCSEVIDRFHSIQPTSPLFITKPSAELSAYIKGRISRRIAVVAPPEAFSECTYRDLVAPYSLESPYERGVFVEGVYPSSVITSLIQPCGEFNTKPARVLDEDGDKYTFYRLHMASPVKSPCSDVMIDASLVLCWPMTASTSCESSETSRLTLELIRIKLTQNLDQGMSAETVLASTPGTVSLPIARGLLQYVERTTKPAPVKHEVSKPATAPLSIRKVPVIEDDLQPAVVVQDMVDVPLPDVASEPVKKRVARTIQTARPRARGARSVPPPTPTTPHQHKLRTRKSYNKNAAVSGNRVDAVLAQMNENVDDATVQAKGCEALCDLATNVENRSIIANNDGINIIASAMAKFTHDAKIQALACAALRNIARDAVHGDRIGESGCIKRIVTAMDSHQDDADVQRYACETFCNITDMNADNRVRVAQAGGINQIVMAISRHDGDDDVQRHACAALRNLCVENTDNVGRIVEAGGVDKIVSVIKSHLNDARVVRDACEALRNLAVDNDYAISRIDDGGGIHAVMSVIEKHHDNENVMSDACDAIWNFCYYRGQSRSKVAKNKGLERIMSVMDAFPRDIDIQRSCCGTLWEFLKSNTKEQRVRIVNNGGKRMVLAAVAAFPDDDEIQESGKRALLKFAQYDSNDAPK